MSTVLKCVENSYMVFNQTDITIKYITNTFGFFDTNMKQLDSIDLYRISKFKDK